MRRSLAALVGVVALLLSSVGFAHADSESIDGSGDIEKLVVNNKDTKVIVKIFAPGGEVHSVEARLKGTDGQIYRAVILNGPDGDKALYKGQGNDVNCSNLSIGYNETGGFWRFAVPRSCLNDLTNRIKARGYWAAVGAPGFSVTDWTPWIPRG